jgi:signal transduction histidine kinase
MDATINGKILVVDDEPMYRELLESALAGYRVETAATAEDAIESLHEFTPDLVLLDVELPGLSGYDFCRALRSDPERRYTKVAFISSHVTLKQRLSGYEAGGDDYITKPFCLDEVLAKVRVLMRLKAVEEVDALKRGFLALISHESLTPLTAIRGSCDLLLHSAELGPDETRRLLGTIARATDRLTDLTEKTLLACRLRDTANVRLWPVPVRGLIDELVGDTEELAAGLGVGIRQDVAPGSVVANPTLLRKALAYALDNAIRFSPPGAAVSVLGRCEGREYRVDVSDAGPGIRPDLLERVFEPFFVDDIVHHSRGSGLSLFLARRIAQLHGGAFELANNPVGGAVTTIRLPIAT